MSHAELSSPLASLSLVSGQFLSLGDDSDPLPESVDPVPPEYLCTVCRQLLRTARQTPCGHRICSPCVGCLAGQHGSERFRCPANEDECEDMTVDEINPDFSATRYLRLLLVYCSNKPFGCPESMPWQKLKDHLCSRCQFNVIKCPNECGAENLPRSQLDEHLRTCPKQKNSCKFQTLGCAYRGGEDELQTHYEENVGYHMEIVTERMVQLDLLLVRLRGSFEAMNADVTQAKAKMSELQNATDSLSRDLQMTMSQLKQSEQQNQRAMSGLNETVVKLEQTVSRLQTDWQRDATNFRERLSQMQSLINELQSNRTGTGAAVANVPEPVRVQLNAHDRTLGIHDVRLAEMDLRIQCAETTNHDGVLIWKVGQYARRKRDAASGGTLSLYSQPFYTSRYGYKMCARVYLNGDGAGRGTHISFFFVVMQGDYDELLTWPFRQRVTLSLLDQRTQRRHLADTFRPDPSSTSFQKPTTPMNVASGCPLFIEHSKLEASDSPYLVNDILYFKITVDTSDLMQP